MFCFFFLWKSSANTYNDLYYNDFCCSFYVIYSSKLNKHILLVMLTKNTICYLRRCFRHLRCTTKIIAQKIDESKVNLDKYYIFTRQIHAKLYQELRISRISRIYYQELYTLKTLAVCYSLWKMHFLIGSGPLIWIYHRQCVIRVTNLKRCLNHSLYHFHESINNVFASFLISKQLLCLIFNLTSSYFISDYV